MDKIKEILELSYSIGKYNLSISEVLLVLLGYVVVRLIIGLLQSKLSKFFFVKDKIDSGRQASLVQIIKYVIYTFFLIYSLEVVGVNLSILLAGSAALLVGLGFGVQHIFNDLISGLIMLFEGHVEMGDVIDAGGLLGRVKRIGLRTSEVRTRDGVTIIVPNAKFITDNVVNWSEQSMVRFVVKVGVAYGSDVRLVEQLLVDCANRHEEVSKRPKAFARFADFGNSSLDFELYFWSSQVWMIENIKSDIRFWIDDAFRQNGVEIPFPQRDLHIRSSDVNFQSGRGEA